MASRIFGAKQLSEPMLGYCQLKKFSLISIKIQSYSLNENGFQNTVCEMADILSRGNKLIAIPRRIYANESTSAPQ